MKLSRLAGDELAVPPGAADLEITGLSLDSRTVAQGMLFAALPGVRADGTRFISEAVARGAAAVLAADAAKVPAGLSVPVLRAADPRRTLAVLAARFHARQPRTIVAVTGTSGKTSVVEFARQIFAASGHRAASLGTIGVVKPDGAVYGALTTPDTITLHRTLEALASEGITHLAMEASSHGLDQHRLDGVRLTAAAFTNLSRDHLDYHPTMQAYLAAKLRLFSEVLPATGSAVVFIGEGSRIDAHGNPMSGSEQPRERAAFIEVLEAARARGVRTLTVGARRGVGDLWGAIDHAGTATVGDRQAELSYGGHRETIRFPLIGQYQFHNALVAAGLAIAAGVPPREALRALADLKGVPGRLELVGTVRGAPVLVDYAHKPEALETVLRELRPATRGKLICVFGCGGDRDKGKRPIMGAIAARLADVTIVTDDNPRSEDPARIRAEILAAAPGAIEIADRADAIARAIKLAELGDVVVIAGKGHETGQIVGSVTLAFSDHDAARAAIAQACRDELR